MARKFNVVKKFKKKDEKKLPLAALKHNAKVKKAKKAKLVPVRAAPAVPKKATKPKFTLQENIEMAERENKDKRAKEDKMARIRRKVKILNRKEVALNKRKARQTGELAAKLTKEKEAKKAKTPAPAKGKTVGDLLKGTEGKSFKESGVNKSFAPKGSKFKYDGRTKLGKAERAAAGVKGKAPAKKAPAKKKQMPTELMDQYGLTNAQANAMSPEKLFGMLMPELKLNILTSGTKVAPQTRSSVIPTTKQSVDDLKKQKLLKDYIKHNSPSGGGNYEVHGGKLYVDQHHFDYDKEHIDATEARPSDTDDWEQLIMGEKWGNGDRSTGFYSSQEEYTPLRSLKMGKIGLKKRETLKGFKEYDVYSRSMGHKGERYETARFVRTGLKLQKKGEQVYDMFGQKRNLDSSIRALYAVKGEPNVFNTFTGKDAQYGIRFNFVKDKGFVERR